MPTKRTRRPKRRSSPYPSPFDPQPPDSDADATSEHEATGSPGSETASATPPANKLTVEAAGRGMNRCEEQAVRMAAENPSLSNMAIGRKLGISEHSSVVRRLGSNGDLRQHVRALLAGVGLDDAALVRKWAQLVQAKEVRHFAYQGKVLDTRHVVALDTRLKAMENVTKLARLYPATTEDSDGKSAGPPALMIQLNLGTTSPQAVPRGLSIALGPSPEVNDAQGEAAPGGSDTTR